MSNKLLIASVYAESDRNEKWLELQLKFLRATTVDFDHAVVCNNTPSSIFTESIVIETKENSKKAFEQHNEGLNGILRYAKNHNYDNCLILDSDCFPYQENWHERLMRHMGDQQIAAVVRIENLDDFPHPCVFFVKNAAFDTVVFSMKERRNLIGNKFSDVMSNISLNKCFPLLRTNCLNIHPLLCGVYWNAFYHHGAGSRADKAYRSMGYYGETINELVQIELAAYRKLTANPESFIKMLTSNSGHLPLSKVFI